MEARRSSSADPPAGAVHYRILVRGEIAPSLSERLAGLTIRVSHREPLGTVSILEGAIVDQAQLVGVVNALYDLRLQLLELSCTPPHVQ